MSSTFEKNGQILPKFTCPIEAAVDMLGGRWKLPIMGQLLSGRMRYTSLKAQLSGISDKMLSQQLNELMNDGLVHRRGLSDAPPHVEYELTELGRSLDQVLSAVVDWSSKHLSDRLEHPET